MSALTPSAGSTTGGAGGTAVPDPLAHVERVPHAACRVELPPALAQAAAERFLASWRGLRGAVHTGGYAGGREVPAGHWALSVDARAGRWIRSVLRGERGQLPARWNHGPRVFVLQPRWALVVVRGCVDDALRALESVKPERLDERGLPHPWQEPAPAVRSLGGDRGREDDVERVSAAPALAAAPRGDRPVLDAADDESVAHALAWAAGQAGFGALPVAIVRQDAVQDGFVGGRVWIAPRGPVKVALEPGPNADAAEFWATIVHELAHGLAGEGGHDRAFRTAMVALAARCFPGGDFAVCHAMLTAATARLDAWLALCIRAALRGAAPPAPQGGEADEGQLARVVARIMKLRQLARSVPGSPEAISASAVANELLVRWDLGAYQVRLSAGIEASMCDRWVDIGRRSVWRRTLAFAVAEHCGVFALSRKDRGWMHFFGCYADVVTAEWFFEIWEAHILRASDAHIARFKARGSGSGRSRSTRSERTDFCDSAVVGLQQKLLATRAGGDGDRRERLLRARDMAEREHGRRGIRWGSGSGKAVTLNREGMAAGHAAPLSRGVGGVAGSRGLLGD